MTLTFPARFLWEGVAQDWVARDGIRDAGCASGRFAWLRAAKGCSIMRATKKRGKGIQDEVTEFGGPLYAEWEKPGEASAAA
jgi:hypothetical protein